MQCFHSPRRDFLGVEHQSSQVRQPGKMLQSLIGERPLGGLNPEFLQVHQLREVCQAGVRNECRVEDELAEIFHPGQVVQTVVSARSAEKQIQLLRQPRDRRSPASVVASPHSITERRGQSVRCAKPAPLIGVACSVREDSR